MTPGKRLSSGASQSAAAPLTRWRVSGRFEWAYRPVGRYGTQAPRSRTEHAIAQRDNKARILEAAVELFSTRAYHAVSVDEVARLAGVSKGGVFHHFGSKYDLASQALLAAFRETWDGYISTAETTIDPIERSRMMIGHLVDMALGSRPLARMTLEIVAVSLTEEGGIEEWVPVLKDVERSVVTALADCGVPEPEAKATILVAAVDNIGLQASMVGPDAGLDSEALKEQFFEVFIGNYIGR